MKPDVPTPTTYNGRIVLLDISRAVAAILVVFAHLYSGSSLVRLFLYSFHMPFFFIISGCLHKEREYFNSFIVLCKSILYPFCLYLIIGMMLMTISSDLSWSEICRGTMADIYHGRFIQPNGVIWFLVVLLEIKLLFPLFLKSKFSIMGGAILFSVLYYYHITNFYILQTLLAIPFYGIGYVLKKHIIGFEAIQCSKFLVFMLLPVVTILAYFNGRISMLQVIVGRLPYLLNLIVFYLNGILGSIMLLSVCSNLIRFRNFFSPTSDALVSILGLQGIMIYTFYLPFAGFNAAPYITLSATIVIILISCFWDKYIYKQYLKI